MQAIEARSENRLLDFIKGIWRDYSVVVVFFVILGICGLAAPRFLTRKPPQHPEEHLHRGVHRPRHDVRHHRRRHRPVQRTGLCHRGGGPHLPAADEEPGRQPGVPLAVAILACCAVAVAFGFVNGTVITKAKLPPFIVTLAVGIIARSVTMYIARGATVMGNNVPQFNRIGSGSIFSIPIPFIVVIVMAILFHILLTRTKYGTYVFAVGGNENAARFSGIKVDRIRIITYMLVGLCTGIASTMEMSRMVAVAAATSGSQYEFEAITAVIVGGTSLIGGKGRLVGTIVGFIILGIVNNMMIMLNISPYLSGAVKGAVILFAVLMQSRERV